MSRNLAPILPALLAAATPAFADCLAPDPARDQALRQQPGETETALSRGEEPHRPDPRGLGATEETWTSFRRDPYGRPVPVRRKRRHRQDAQGRQQTAPDYRRIDRTAYVRRKSVLLATLAAQEKALQTVRLRCRAMSPAKEPATGPEG